MENKEKRSPKIIVWIISRAQTWQFTDRPYVRIIRGRKADKHIGTDDRQKSAAWEIYCLGRKKGPGGQPKALHLEELDQGLIRSLLIWVWGLNRLHTKVKTRRKDSLLEGLSPQSPYKEGRGTDKGKLKTSIGPHRLLPFQARANSSTSNPIFSFLGLKY